MYENRAPAVPAGLKGEREIFDFGLLFIQVSKRDGRACEVNFAKGMNQNQLLRDVLLWQR